MSLSRQLARDCAFCLLNSDSTKYKMEDLLTDYLAGEVSTDILAYRLDDLSSEWLESRLPLADEDTQDVDPNNRSGAV